jgi:hypothetical protein
MRQSASRDRIAEDPVALLALVLGAEAVAVAIDPGLLVAKPVLGAEPLEGGTGIGTRCGRRRRVRISRPFAFDARVLAGGVEAAALLLAAELGVVGRSHLGGNRTDDESGKDPDDQAERLNHPLESGGPAAICNVPLRAVS